MFNLRYPITLQKIWEILLPKERWSTGVLLGLMIIGMGLETISIGLVIPALALLTTANPAILVTQYPNLPFLDALSNFSQARLIGAGMLTLVAIYVLKALFFAFLAVEQTRFAFGAQAQLSQRLFALYLGQPYTFHLQRNSAQMIRNVVNEIDRFTFQVLIPGLLLVTEWLVLAGLTALLLAIEPFGTVIIVSVLGLAGWGFHQVTHKRVTRWGEGRQFHDGLRIQHLQQGLGGVKEIKLLGRESEFLKQYHTHNVESARMGQLQQTLVQLPRLWLELLAVIGLATLVLIMLAQGFAPESILPTLGLFAAAAFRLMPSVYRMMGAAQTLKYGLPIVTTLHEELSLPVPAVGAHTPKHESFKHALELRQVSFAYPNAAVPALNNISLTIAGGESVGIVGPSGAGKSTLVDILLGLLTPDAGEVCIDGQNIQRNLRQWQHQIGYVPQVIFLTDDTLRRNVAFGLPNAQIDEDTVKRVIRAAQLEDFVNGLPEGLDTFVGERGVRLSGGQRQRIGIARALYYDPAVLVLDEATSALDTTTERGVIDAIRALQHGTKTVIIVAHRLSTAKHCKRLYKIEMGMLVPQERYVLGKV